MSVNPVFKNQKYLAQQYCHTALHRTFHRSTENTFEHKNRKYLYRTSKKHFISAEQTRSTD